MAEQDIESSVRKYIWRYNSTIIEQKKVCRMSSKFVDGSACPVTFEQVSTYIQRRKNAFKSESKEDIPGNKMMEHLFH